MEDLALLTISPSIDIRNIIVRDIILSVEDIGRTMIVITMKERGRNF